MSIFYKVVPQSHYIYIYGNIVPKVSLHGGAYGVTPKSQYNGYMFQARNNWC